MNHSYGYGSAGDPPIYFANLSQNSDPGEISGLTVILSCLLSRHAEDCSYQ